MRNKSRGYITPSLGGDDSFDASVGRKAISAFGDGGIDLRSPHIPTAFGNARCWRTGRFLVPGLPDGAAGVLPCQSTTTPASVLAHGAEREVVMVGEAGGQGCLLLMNTSISAEAVGAAAAAAATGAARQGREPHPLRAKPISLPATGRHRGGATGGFRQGYAAGGPSVVLYVRSCHVSVPDVSSHSARLPLVAFLVAGIAPARELAATGAA